MVFKFPKIFSSYTDWLEKQQTSILSAAAIITIANFLSSFSGLIRYRLLITQFFHTPTGQQHYEAFNIAFQIPDLMYQLLVSGALSAAFIPTLTGYKNDKKAEQMYMNTMMNSVLLVFTFFAVIVFIFAEPLTRMRTGPAFSQDQVEVAANLTRVMIFGQIFLAMSNFFTGMLQSYKRFIVPAFSPVLYNIGIVLGTYMFYPYLGIYAAGVGVMIGAAMHMLVQLPYAWKIGFRFRPIMNLKQEGVRHTYKLAPARASTLAVFQIQQLATGFFATSIGNLSFVVMNLAYQLMSLPIRFFGVPISQAALPFLSDELDDKNQTRFRDLILKSIHQISFFAFPASVMLLILRIPIVRLAFGAKGFDWELTTGTGMVVAIMSLSIGAQAIVQLLIRAFHILKNSRIPFYITIATVGIYLFFSSIFTFIFKWGVNGMALALTISYIIEMLLFLYFLDKRIQGFMSKAFWVPQLKMITASFLMAIFVYLPFRVLDKVVFETTRTVELILLTIITGTIGMLVYIYFAALFDIRELYILRSLVDKFGNWKKTLAKSEEVILETGAETQDQV